MIPELNLKFYKSFDGYLAKLNIPENVVANSSTNSKEKPNMYILLDRSGSMGQNVHRLTHDIIPMMLTKLGYTNEQITLITFDTSIEVYKKTITELKTEPLHSRGLTYFAKAILKLSEIITGSRVRILTISDGAMHDINDAVLYANKYANAITNTRKVNSQAVRYYTSSLQPETRGVACVLQFNNSGTNKLLDISASSNSDGHSFNAELMYDLFNNDGLDNPIIISTNEEVMANDPWGTSVNNLHLNTGDNLLWFKELPKSININGINATVKSVVADEVTSANITDIIENRFNYYSDRIRILKVINSVESKEEITNILTYFEKFQTYLDTTNMVSDDKYTPGLQYRYNSLKRNIEQRKKSLYMRLQQLANDNMISKLNAAQQADYLRGVEVSKNAKGLARRALKTGFDLTEVVHNEVKAIASHIKELDDIDDTNHKKSFYSMESTLEGLKTLANIVEDNILDETNASDIIQLTNIVGIGSYHSIGDYPDAMAFRTHDLFPGAYMSVSDITVTEVIDKHNKLSPPGQPDKQIVNVIPIFDDDRIHKFWLTYAPTILNLVAGVGMRRVLADVPSTHMYTVCAGLWKAIDMVAINRSEIMIETVKQLTHTYDIDVGTYFDHNEKFLVPQNVQTSYFINNNGLTNSLNLIYRQIKKGNTEIIPQFMRAIYCYEFYQTTKKIINKADDKLAFVRNTLVELLHLDYEKYGTKVGEPFTETPPPKHDMTYEINNTKLQELTYNYKYFRNAFMCPVIFQALQSDNYIKAVQDLPEITDDFLGKELSLNYDSSQFVLYNLVEALVYHTKQLRVNDKSDRKMNIPDVGYKSKAEKMIHTVIRNYYQRFYNSNARAKGEKEQEIAINKMIEALTTSDFETYLNILENGYDYHGKKVQIINTCSQGFIELYNNLTNTSLDIPERFKKIYVFVLGKTDEKIIWNAGNAIRMDMTPFKNTFEYFGKEKQWDALYIEFANSVKHIYRGEEDKANRHSHHNNKPSYWALGYETVIDMYNKVSSEEFEKYKQIHKDCCGFNPIPLYQRKKKEKYPNKIIYKYKSAVHHLI